jgi:hypothetical protein
MYMSGGTISGNSALGALDGGVYVNGSSKKFSVALSTA